MSEMIERVAKYIAAEIMELTAKERQTFSFPDDVNGDTYERAMSAARATIEAMRDPTDEMKNAPYADTIIVGGDFVANPREADEIWRSMIAAALKEP